MEVQNVRTWNVLTCGASIRSSLCAGGDGCDISHKPSSYLLIGWDFFAQARSSLVKQMISIKEIYALTVMTAAAGIRIRIRQNLAFFLWLALCRCYVQWNHVGISINMLISKPLLANQLAHYASVDHVITKHEYKHMPIHSRRRPQNKFMLMLGSQVRMASPAVTSGRWIHQNKYPHSLRCWIRPHDSLQAYPSKGSELIIEITCATEFLCPFVPLFVDSSRWSVSWGTVQKIAQEKIGGKLGVGRPGRSPH